MIHQVEQLSYGLKKRLEGEWEKVDVFHLGLEAVQSVENLLFYYNQKSKMKETKLLFDSLPIQTRNQLNVTGNDILEVFDRKPGKWLGDLIASIETAVINGEILNEKEELLFYAQERVPKEE